MPIYEYVCGNCGNEFEKLVFSYSADVVCPDCSSTELERKVSLFGFKGGRESVETGGSSVSSSCASCSAKTCSSCR
jgi:putative FmdB family regulatory protein